MSAEQLVFYSFAALALISALAVILARNSVKAVLSLVLTFFFSAGIWLLLEAEFLSITLVLVYVGAVMVLFLFVVMMLDIDYAAIRQGFIRYLPLGLLVSVVFMASLYWLISGGTFSAEAYPEPAKASASYSNIRMLGLLLYTDYFLAFELAAVILLVAIVAAISLTFRGKRQRKSQDVERQLNVSKSDRLRIVKMQPDRKRRPKMEVSEEEDA